MNSIKRLVITTFLGLIGGVVAVGMTIGVGASLPPEIIMRILLNFTLMGFAIGVSKLRWHWTIHGLFFGMVLGTLEGLASVVAGFPFAVPVVYGLIIGVLIEFIATVVFKAGVQYSATNASP